MDLPTNASRCHFSGFPFRLLWPEQHFLVENKHITVYAAQRLYCLIIFPHCCQFDYQSEHGFMIYSNYGTNKPF